MNGVVPEIGMGKGYRPGASTVRAAAAALALIVTGPAGAQLTPGASLTKCESTTTKEGVKFADGTAKAIGTCLQKMASGLIQHGLSTEDAAADAAATCVSQFRKLNDSRGLGVSLPEKLSARVAATCEPGQPGVTHSLNDVTGQAAGLVSEPIETTRIDAWCQEFGGDGSIDSVAEWIACLRTAHACAARLTISTQYPRALEWLDALIPAMGAVTPPASDPSRIADALVAANAVNDAIEGVDDDDVPAIQCGSGTPAPPTQGFPATGQTTCWNTAGSTVPCPGTGHDGAIQAGATLAYTDNGDGTITDQNTGLMWEKKSDDGGIHDKDASYTWDNAFALHVAGLNVGSGFAGHTDWRVPNVKELQSIVNYNANGPAISSVFNSGCAPGCTVLTCSCTPSSSLSWTSTTGRALQTQAWYVGFFSGFILANDKTVALNVRAVRGGL